MNTTKLTLFFGGCLFLGCLHHELWYGTHGDPSTRVALKQLWREGASYAMDLFALALDLCALGAICIERLVAFCNNLRDLTLAVGVCLCLDQRDFGQSMRTWTTMTRDSQGNAFYSAQQEFGRIQGLRYLLLYIAYRTVMQLICYVLIERFDSPTAIWAVSFCGNFSGLIVIFWRNSVVSFMPNPTSQPALPHVKPGDVKFLDGQLIVNVDGRLIELDQYSIKYDVQQTERGLQLKSLEVGPIKPVEATERPEASIPGQLCEPGPLPRNAIKLWVRDDNNQWRVSCIMNFWRDPVKGHVATTVLHGLAHLAQHEVKDMGVTSATMGEAINGGNPFPLLDFLKSSTFDVSTTWEATNYDGHVSAAVLHDNWKAMHSGWKPSMQDLVVVTTNVNFASLSVQLFNLKTITSFQATGKLYSVCNWDPSRTGYYPARIENMPDKARLHGLVQTSASTWPGTSGSAALTPQKELMFVHAGGPQVAMTEYPNVGYVSTLVKQVIRKHTGGDPRPLYRQGIALHDSVLMQEIRMVCEEVEQYENQFQAFKDAGKIPADLTFSPLTPAEAAICQNSTGMYPESGHSHLARQAMIKNAYTKLRKSSSMKGKSNSAIYTFIYHKMSDTIPEVDPDGIIEAEKRADEEFLDWVDKNLHGSAEEDYQVVSDHSDDETAGWYNSQRHAQPVNKRARHTVPQDDREERYDRDERPECGVVPTCGDVLSRIDESRTNPECGLCHKFGYQAAPEPTDDGYLPGHTSCFWQNHNIGNRPGKAPRVRGTSVKAVRDEPDGVLSPPPNLGRPDESYLFCDKCGEWDYCRNLPFLENDGIYPSHYCPCMRSSMEDACFAETSARLEVEPATEAILAPAVAAEPPKSTGQSDLPALEEIVGVPTQEVKPEAAFTAPKAGTAAKRCGTGSRRIVNKRLSRHGAEIVAQAALPRTYRDLLQSNETHTSKYSFSLSFRRALETGWLKRVTAKEGSKVMYQACFPESSAHESCFEHHAVVNEAGQLDYPETLAKETEQLFFPADFDHVIETQLRPLIEIDTATNMTLAEWCTAVQKVGKELSPSGSVDYSFADTSLFRNYLGAETQCEPVDFHGETDPSFRYVGKPPMAPPGKRREFSDPQPTDLMLAWGLVDEWGRAKGAKPPQGPAHEIASLKAQLKRKSARTRGYSMAHLKEYASGLPVPAMDWSIPITEHVAQINSRMEASKSSGWSRLNGSRTNGEWVSNPHCVRGGLLTVALAMLTDHKTLSTWSAEQLYRAGLVVPEEASIKDETHMRKKIETKRWRLIWMTSARAQFVARFFHDCQNKTELDLYRGGFTHSAEFPYFGSCGGMGHDDDGIKGTCEAFTRLSEAPNSGDTTNGLTSLDAKGWDFSVSRTLLMADAWRRAHLAEVSGAPAAFCLGVLNMGLTLSAHILRSGMAMFAITVFGIVGSGMISTTASNSFMRSFAHSEAFWHVFGRVARSLANGDDCVGHDMITQHILEIWEELGLQLDDEEDIRTHSLADFIHFTSHIYSVAQEAATYGNQDKLFLKIALLHAGGKTPTAEQIAGIRVAIRHTPEAIEKMDAFVKRCCPGYEDVDWGLVHPDMSLMDA